MKSNKGWLGRTLCVAVLFVAVPVWADEPAKPVVVAAKPVAAAEEAYNEGKRLAEAGKWLAALTLFEKAYDLDPSPNRAAHLGRAQVMTEAYAAGATNLERYLREEKDPPADRRAAIEQLLHGAKEKVATVTLKVDEPGVAVRIGTVDVPTERLSWPQYVAPGTHVFEATKPGFEVSTETRDVVAGSAIEVAFKMKVARVVKPEGSVRKDEPKQLPAKVNPLWIAGGALGIAAIGTGIGAIVTYAWSAPGARALEEVEKTKSCNTKCMADADMYFKYNRPSQVLTIATTLLGLTTAGMVVGMGLKREPLFQKSHAGNVSFTIYPGIGGVVLHGTW